MSDLVVDTDKLRDLAGTLDGSAHETQTLLRRARDADVPADAWGPMGDHRGLPALYLQVLDQADTCLAQIHGFLGWAADNLTATAVEYDEHENAMVHLFQRLQNGDASGGTL